MLTTPFIESLFSWMNMTNRWVIIEETNLLEVERMKRFPLILLSLLLIAACAVSFAEEAPWVTMENVREHSGNVWREEIPHYNGAEEQGFQPLAMDPAEAWQRLRESKWSPAERLCFGSLSARQTFSIMGIQIFQPRMCRWCRSSVFPDGAGVKKEP